MANGDTRTQQYLNIAANGNRADLPTETCCETRTQTLTREVAERVIRLDEEVQEIKNNPDVVDIVDTYADLQAYDTQHLTDNDIIRVLQDETHNGNSTYYRFTKNPDTWTFIGEIPGSSIVPVQTTGDSTTDVMSQNATTSMVFADPSTKTKIQVGGTTTGSYSVSIGSQGVATATNSVAIQGAASKQFGVAIGTSATASAKNSVALGAYSTASYQGQFDIGSGGDPTVGYNNSAYRLLTGLYDGQSAHDAATVGQAIGTTETYAVATADWSALSASSPYDYQTTVTATYTIGNATIIELINDSAIDFATYGFAIGSVSGQNVTIYSIGQPSASMSLKINYKG